jgi:hypothetical protein
MTRIRSTALIAAPAFVAGVFTGPSLLGTATASAPNQAEGTIPTRDQQHAQCEAMMER